MGFGFKTDKEETAGGVVEVIQAQGEEWYAVGALKEVALAQKHGETRGQRPLSAAPRDGHHPANSPLSEFGGTRGALILPTVPRAIIHHREKQIKVV